ncbi:MULTISPECIES: hypothetical protein [Bacillaceae]|uniref:Uncharacterized protein n=1 Tax=Metabacillus sediminis TaxID=3117746 RepID=A0ABZ2NLB2_9BACI|nr:hypothetical protein [Bacillus sp. SJS]KZZ84747.1 hypothetical protein AS29_009455 [Bacillus sp. SJS]
MYKVEIAEDDFRVAQIHEQFWKRGKWMEVRKGTSSWSDYFKLFLNYDKPDSWEKRNHLS